MAKNNAVAGFNSLQGVELGLFTLDELNAIHYATMEILMNPGIQVSDAEARKIFKENGCEVDEDTKVVKIPEYLVRKALQLAPSRFVLWGRDKKYNTVQESGGKVHWTCFGTGVKVCRYRDGKYVTVDSVEQDIADIAKLCDWAENIDTGIGLEKVPRMSMRPLLHLQTPPSTIITLTLSARTSSTTGTS
jgi:trimethylamine--corrinoid protein Co-methyltransferase